MKDEKTETPEEPDPLANKIVITRFNRWLSFIIFVFLIFFISNIDNGVITASTKQIMEDLDLGEPDVGLLTSTDYIGRVVGSIGIFYIINKYNRKILLLGATLFKAFSLIIYTYGTSFWVLLLGRFLCGINQVFYTIYYPVWCDQYGSKKSRPVMVALFQIACPLGIVFGYGLCLAIKSWRIANMVESVFLFGFCFAIFTCRDKYFSTTLSQINQDSENSEEKSTVSSSVGEVGNLYFRNIPKSAIKESNILLNLRKILFNFMFLCGVFPYAFSFYTMGALKLWAPHYMEKVIKEGNETKRFMAFSIISITGPTIGLIFGGFSGKLIGGYTGKLSILLCLVYDILGCVTGFATLVFGDGQYYPFVIVTWVFFFFSTAVIPLETGLILSSVDEELKGDVFSVTNSILNIVGNIPPTYVYGLIDKEYGERFPKLALFFSFVVRCLSLLFLVPGAIYKYFKKEETTELKEEIVPNNTSA